MHIILTVRLRPPVDSKFMFSLRHSLLMKTHFDFVRYHRWLDSESRLIQKSKVKIFFNKKKTKNGDKAAKTLINTERKKQSKMRQLT